MRVLLLALFWLTAAPAAELGVTIAQITFGPQHHFFGYIGHARTVPWNQSGRYILALRTAYQDHMPGPGDAAEVVLIDTRRNHLVIAVDRSRAWNFQQGTMFYWNPQAPETQFFFNDRDPRTNHVFTVLYDIEKKKRVREYRYPDTPFANSGVAQNGGWFLGINYGRLARLRPVTGYPGAFDWNPKEAAPANDGIFLVNTESGAKKLLVSFRQLAELVPRAASTPLFINHTLWNRDDNRIYFYVRGNFDVKDGRIDVPCSIHPDGTGLAMHPYIGGHPEWEAGPRVLGSLDGRYVLYDVDRREVVGGMGTPEVFPNSKDDGAFSPDQKWFVNGYRVKDQNFYVVFRRPDSAWVQTRGFPHPGWTSGDLRVDAAPRWNRTGDQILVGAIADDKERTRQLFVIRVGTQR
jgi:hypothetical protein